jgi:nitroreductase
MTDRAQADRASTDEPLDGRAVPDALDARLAGYVRAAGRAPSAHNTQPWAPRVVDGAVEVSMVPSRTLPAGDPTFRDLLLSLGTWVESVAVVAAADGLVVSVEPLPALCLLEDLPVEGPADPGLPVLRLTFTDADGDADVHAHAHASAGGVTPGLTTTDGFTATHVRDRRVFRGTLLPAPDVWRDSPRLPAWLRLLEVDDPAMRQLVCLGTAYTASRPTVAAELVRWLRLSPDHPRYTRDGMTDQMLALPAPVARLAAPFTRRPALHDPLVAMAGMVGRAAEGLGRGRPLPRRPEDQSDVRVRHLVLVADPGARAGTAGVSGAGRAPVTQPVESRIGIPEDAAVEAGRALQRLWLHAHVQGLVVAPHSEVVDSPAAHGALRRRLGLRRSEVALSVFSAGIASGPVARSPRLDGA